MFLRVEFSSKFWKSEAILPTDALGVSGPFVFVGTICSVFLDVLRFLQVLCRRGGKIWITSWGMRRSNPCESRRLLLKSLHNEVLWVFTATPNSLFASFFLHCLGSYTYIDDTLYKQPIEVYRWFISILRTFLRWIVSITCFVSTSQIWLEVIININWLLPLSPL